MELVSLVIPLGFLGPSGLKIWMQKRHGSGLVEFPGGKLNSGEDPGVGAKREFQEEVGLALEECTLFKILRHGDILLYAHTSFFEDLWAPEGKWYPLDFEQKHIPYQGKTHEANYELLDDLAQWVQTKGIP